jgi:hypothetical protein
MENTFGTDYNIYNKMTFGNVLPTQKFEQNGRIHLLEPEDKMARFKMVEKVSLRNKATDYTAATAYIWENNILSQAFFSKENIQILQNAIRRGVYDLSKQQYIVPNQNIDALKIIMRSIFLQYAEFGKDEVTAEIEKLNKLVLDYCIPYVFNEAKFYMRYLYDQSTLVVPFDRCFKNDRVYKQLEPKFY